MVLQDSDESSSDHVASDIEGDLASRRCDEDPSSNGVLDSESCVVPWRRRFLSDDTQEHVTLWVSNTLPCGPRFSLEIVFREMCMSGVASCNHSAAIPYQIIGYRLVHPIGLLGSLVHRNLVPPLRLSKRQDFCRPITLTACK